MWQIFAKSLRSPKEKEDQRLKWSTMSWSNIRRRIRFSIVHRQPAGSNLCGPLVCAFMSDILDGRSPENIVYCKEEQQRQWLADVMGTEKFTVCPKKGAGRRPADALTTGRPDEVITPADATSFRVSLSTGTSRRISNILNKVWVLCWFSIKIQQKSSNGWL